MQLLQALHAECRRHMPAQKLCISFKGAASGTFFLSAGCTNRKPMLNPITERHPGRFNMLPVVAGFQQFAELLFGLCGCAVERHCEALLADAITQPEGIFSALVNTAVAV